MYLHAMCNYAVILFKRFQLIHNGLHLLQNQRYAFRVVSHHHNVLQEHDVSVTVFLPEPEPGCRFDV